MLSVGGLFSGIGGIELGLERAGMRVLWHCEQEPYARAVLERHWPGVPCYEDVRELRGANVEPVDVLCGGFPCQDISLAGDGAGIDGARSGLWSEYARLVGELRPRYVVVENVAALLGRGLGRVLADLSALGYDAEWDCIPASAVGAPHQRDRIWLVAYPQSTGLEGGRPVGPSTGVRRQLADSHRSDAYADGGGFEVGAQLDREPQQDPADGHPRRRHADRLRDEVADAERSGPQGHGRWALRARTATGGSALGDPDEERRHRRPGQLGPAGRREPSDAGWWLAEPDVGRVAHGIPKRVDRLRCLGNAVVPQIPTWIGTRIIEWEGGLT